MYAAILRFVAKDIEAHGPCYEVVKAHKPEGGVPPTANIRAFMAAVHYVVLETPDTDLARYYPSVGGKVDLAAVGPAFRTVVSDHRERIQHLMGRPVQTNEVTRSRALVGGFLLAAERTGLPLRVLELGASGGLNLRWDQYRYEVDGVSWGDVASPVKFVDGFSAGRPPLHLHAEVVERRGCDLSPIDAATREGQHVLLSHVWADQTERVELLRQAFEVAERIPAPIDRQDALSWVTAQLAEPRPGVCTVVFDTAVKEYMPPGVITGIEQTIAEAGARATPEAPVARLHIEPRGGLDGVDGELELVVWPGAHRATLAQTSDAWARGVRWVGPENDAGSQAARVISDPFR